MDAFLLPSLFEGFPLTAVEAYASGLPVLLSDHITREAKLGDAVAFFPLDGTFDTLADTVLAMEIPVEERESRGKELAVLGLDWGTQAEKMMVLYQTALQK